MKTSKVLFQSKISFQPANAFENAFQVFNLTLGLPGIESRKVQGSLLTKKEEQVVKEWLPL